MRLHHAAALALAFLASACVFPPWDERPGAGDDDDTTPDELQTVELLCVKFDECGGSKWETPEQCIEEFPLLMAACEDYAGFFDCAAPCAESGCDGFITCLDACSWNHCFPED